MIVFQADKGVSPLSDKKQHDKALKLGADTISTDGLLKPVVHENLLADMHTHSEYSHDSVCKVEDMLIAQLKKGTNIFAVTDHFDTESFIDFDVFQPIKNSVEKVRKLNEKYNGQSLILSGIEISEGFHLPNIFEKAIKMLNYDVVIGSVHIIHYNELDYAYSKIDFSKLSKNTILNYLDMYFDDILKMINLTDFDILAHLTCPLRYIVGKFKIKIDLSLFEEKIEKILQQIIKKGIALELNTSSVDFFGLMPDISILKKYYDMGGYLITLGSDAHIAENASLHFSEALKTLKQIGFENIYYYKNRIPCQIKI